MTRYEEAFDTDWDALSVDEATEHAYAIGVAEKLGEYNREHLERIYEDMDSTYERSVVELAYDEGRKDATTLVNAEEIDESGDLWQELVDGKPVHDEEPESFTRGRDGLPEALDKAEVLQRLDIDSTDITDRPGFLDG